MVMALAIRRALITSISRLASAIGIDSSVFYSVGARIFSFAAAPVTLLLIVKSLSKSEQGYYYTFAAVLNSKVLFELGFAFVLMQFSSHQMVDLSWSTSGILVGPAQAKERLGALIRIGAKWYCISAGVFLLGATLVGIGVFSTARGELAVGRWLWPWIALVVGQAANLALSPYFAILEGCGRVAEVAKYRVLETTIQAVILWVCLYAGLGLYSCGIAAACMFSAAFAYLLLRWRFTLFDLVRSPNSEPLNWMQDIWPFQWRIALSWGAGYFVSQIFAPLIFISRGPVESGRFGMTFSLVSAVSAAALAWVTTKAPRLGTFAKQESWGEMDKLFRRSAIRGFFVCIVGLLVLILAIVLSQPYAISARILGAREFCLLAVATAINFATASLAVYLRAHGREPFLPISIINGVLSASVAGFMAWRWGALGVCVGYAAVQALVVAPLAVKVFASCRRKWHVAENIC